jgi:flagellar basal-body rod protein FlgB
MMMGLLGEVFGPHELALRLRGERAGVLAANLANADTPGYKARDLDFATLLAAQGQEQSSLPMAVTQGAHLGGADAGGGAGELLYRIPFQPSRDGNTVESQVEFAAFGANAVRYQASLMFINRRIAGIESALTGQ